MRKKYLKVKIAMEVDRLAREQAEEIIADLFVEAQKRLELEFERLTQRFASEIRRAIENDYMFIEKKKLKVTKK